MIAMFMGEQNPVELLWGYAALFKPEDDLARAQSAID